LKKLLKILIIEIKILIFTKIFKFTIINLTMDIKNYLEFRRRTTKDFIKYNAFEEFYEDIINKTEEIYLKVKNNEKYTNKTTFIGCLLLSNKFIMDIPINNLSFAKLFFIDLKKINEIEIFFLEKLNWTLN
jgi:hypothetical protein